jgi:hypothetical protein
MGPLLAILLGVGLLGIPLPAPAEPTTDPVPPAVAPAFDEINEARQAEIERQVLVFLRNLQRYWGKSQETLRRTLSDTLVRDEHGKLIYSHLLAEHGVIEGYEFEDGVLVHGLCRFVQQPVNELNEFIEYYGTVKNALISAYGVPVQDQMIWENDLYEPLPDYWGFAVQMGHLRFSASWETPEGTLSIELTGQHHSQLTVDYRYRQAGRLT